MADKVFKTQVKQKKPTWKRTGAYWIKRIGDNYLYVKKLGYKRFDFWYKNEKTGDVMRGILTPKTVEHAKRLADKFYPEFLTAQNKE